MEPEKLDLRSHTIAADKRAELLRLFPEIRTEGGKLDFERPEAGAGRGGRHGQGTLRHELARQGRLLQDPANPESRHPTSQNQVRIEADLRASLTRFGLDRPEQALRLRAEMVIRNYDPCISCATHFLRLRLERDEAGAMNGSPASARRVVVLGVGTEQAGDDVGLRMVECLRDDAALANGSLALYATSRPALDWQRCVRAGDRVFVIDALLETADEYLQVMDGGMLASGERAWSSHGLGLAEARDLCARLGQAAESVTVLGIAVGALGETPTASAQLQPLVQEIRDRLFAGLPASPAAVSAGTTKTTASVPD